MDINPKDQKEMIKAVFKAMRLLEGELIVHRYVLSLAVRHRLIPQEVVDQAIAAARDNPKLESILAEKYKFVDDLLLAVDKAEILSKAAELMRNWPRSDLPN